MKEIRQRFFGAMNSDDSDKDVPEGDYRDLINLRSGISKTIYQNIPEAIQSPLLKTVAGGPSASTSIRIGAGIDKENDKIYFLYHEPGVADFVIALDTNTEATSIIFKDPIGTYNVMKLDPLYPVYNTRILNGKLFWTDNNEEPRYLKIDKAIQYMDNNFDTISVYSGEWLATQGYVALEIVGHNGYFWQATQVSTNEEPYDGSAYWYIKSLILDSYKPQLFIEDILFIATPPIDPSTYTYITDNSRKSNNLRGNLYQFAYRWIYDDFRKSVFGPVSGITVPEGEELYNGEPNSDLSVNNRIDIGYNSGGSGVMQVEIIFRSSKDASTWYRVAVVNKYDDNDYQVLRDYQDRVYSFFDDVVPYAVSDTEVYKPFHYVPQKAGFLEVIEDNHIIFGDCREGYPEVKLSVVVEKSIVGGTTDPIIITMHVEIVSWDLTPDPPNPLEEEGHYMIILPEVGYTGSAYKIVEYSNNYAVVKIATYVMLTGDEAGYPNSVRDALVAECVTQGIDVDTCYAQITLDGIICFNRSIVQLGQIENYYETIGYRIEGQVLDPEELIAKYINLKAGSTHGLGMVYYEDRRRQNPVSATKEMGVYLDFYNDDRGSGNLEHDEHWEVKLIINHIPPPFATHYHIVYTGNLSMSYWVHARISTIAFQTDYIEININAWIDAVKVLYRNFEVNRYDFQSGDRMRVIGYIDSGTFTMYGRYVDVEVVGTDPEDDDLLRIQRYLNDTDLTTDHVIEIYRPKRTTTTNLYYEIAQKYPIIQTVDGPVHGGDVQQVVNSSGQSTTPAEVTIVANDSYKYRRELLDITPFYCESDHLSDYMRPSNLAGLGFPKIEDELAQQVRMKNRLRFGGILSIGTKNNQIADFEYDDYTDLPEKHGGIYGLQELGFVLKIIQAHKLWSIYIKRTSSFNPDGSENIILTNAILGTKRPSVEDWGTQNPESVCVHERYLYFWDRSTSQFIRDSANGPFAISSFKMMTYFRDITASARGYTDAKCVVGVNQDFKEIFLHWYWNGSHQGTLVFNEAKKRWTHRTSEQTDTYINFGSILVATHDEKIYIHNRGADYTEYNGNYGQELIDFVVNGDPDKVKIWKAMSMKSQLKYFNGNPNGLRVPVDPNYPDGMETRFPQELMEAKEGIYYAPIMKDINTPKAGWSDDEKALNGREMRGQVLLVTLKRISTGEFSFFENVRVRYTESETS